jgi:uncharacterized OsmC-like protein
MGLSVTFRGGSRFEISSRAHTVVTDQPVEEGGQDAGMTPVELFVGSLASCVAYFVGRFCARHQIACEGFTVEADWSYTERPHRIGSVSLRIKLPAPVTAEQRERLLKVAHGCTVHQSLAVPMTVNMALEHGQVEGASD